MRAVTAPLFTLQFDLDARAFAFGNRTTQSFDQRLDVRERNRRQCRTRKNSDECLAMLRVHIEMISNIDIIYKIGYLLSAYHPGL